MRIALRGLWDQATLDAYAAEVTGMEQRLSRGGPLPKSVGVLLDLREHVVQTQEIAQAIIKHAERQGKSVPCAIISSSSALHRLQMQRMSAPLENQRSFSDEQQALSWLTEQQRQLRDQG